MVDAMAVLVAVLIALVVLLAVTAGVEYLAARRVREQVGAAETRATEAELVAAQERERADDAERASTEAASSRNAALEKADTQARDHANLEARLNAAESRAEVAERRSGELEQRLAALTPAPTPAELADSGTPIAAEPLVDTGLANPDLLWALEVVRTARTWRYSVALGPDAGTPFKPGDDPLRVSVEVEAAALREESGAQIGVDWDLPMRLDTSRSLIVLRAAQETLAAAARLADTVVLGVLADGGDVVLTLRGPDADDPAIELPLDALPEAEGFERLPDGVRVLGAAIPAYEG